MVSFSSFLKDRVSETTTTDINNLSVHFQSRPENCFQTSTILLRVNGSILFIWLKLYMGIALLVNWAFSCQIVWLVTFSELQHKIPLPTH